MKHIPKMSDHYVTLEASYAHVSSIRCALRFLLPYAHLILGMGVCISICTTCHGAQELKIQKQNRITAVVSKKHINRLSFEGDRITQMYGKAGFSVDIDAENGQAFLDVQQDAPIYVSVITEKGITQDLTLTPKDTEPQTLLFKPSVDKPPKDVSSNASYYKGIHRFLSAMKDQRPLDGVEVSTDQKTSRPLPEGTALESRTIYKGQTIMGERIVFTNRSDTRIDLDETRLKRGGDIAIAVSSVSVDPDTEATLYIIRKVS